MNRKGMKSGLNDIVNSHSFKQLARTLSLVENDSGIAEDILKGLSFDQNIPVIGITGPPGAGKSTLLNALITELLKTGKRIAVLAIDPTSAFNNGSLLGDRIRMTAHFNHPDVFIRSLATRGAFGGLSLKTIEMTDVLRSAGFDYIFIETVGVGQSEIDIAGLADVTLVVLVPEAGDEIQHIKSGLMEIADVFVINKADRADADIFAGNLKKALQMQHLDIPVFKTVAVNFDGMADVLAFCNSFSANQNAKKTYLLVQKAYQLIQHRAIQKIDKARLAQTIEEASAKPDFNIYRFVQDFI